MNTFHLGSCDDYTNSRPSRWDFRHRHYVRPLYAYPVGIRKADFVRQARTSHYTLNTWHPTISQAAFRHCPSYGFVRQAVAVFTILATDAALCRCGSLLSMPRVALCRLMPGKVGLCHRIRFCDTYAGVAFNIHHCLHTPPFVAQALRHSWTAYYCVYPNSQLTPITLLRHG